MEEKKDSQEDIFLRSSPAGTFGLRGAAHMQRQREAGPVGAIRSTHTVPLDHSLANAMFDHPL